MRGNKTREKILDTSLLLFNEKKASNVSTVQISSEMKISPGNLYYYFANREDVIRCIWRERMVEEIEELMKEQQMVLSVRQFRDFMERCIKHGERYRFFYTELPTLLTNDPGLEELCSTVGKESADVLEAMLDRWIDSGLMKPVERKIKRIIGNNCRAVLWNAIIQEDAAVDSMDQQAFRESTYDHLTAIVEPYLH